MIEAASIGIPIAFVAGFVSFLSPCVLPLVPGYVSYVAGGLTSASSGDVSSWQRLRTVGLSLGFVLGFSTVFIALGASASAIGTLLLTYRYELNIVGGLIVMVFGLFHDRRGADQSATIRFSISYVASRRQALVLLCSGACLRVWMDTMYWSNPGCHSNGVRSLRRYQQRHDVAGHLFSRARRAVCLGRNLHRQTGERHKIDASHRTMVLQNCWCDLDLNGRRYGHGHAISFLILVARCVSGLRSVGIRRRQ